jgi:hypothetical protein
MAHELGHAADHDQIGKARMTGHHMLSTLKLLSPKLWRDAKRNKRTLRQERYWQDKRELLARDITKAWARHHKVTHFGYDPTNLWQVPRQDDEGEWQWDSTRGT